MIRYFIIMIWMIIISPELLTQCLQQIDFYIYIRSGARIIYVWNFHSQSTDVLYVYTQPIVRFQVWMSDVCPRLWISVKKMHESASGVSMANVTTNRPYQTSQKIYFSEPIEGVRGEVFSLSYSEMRKCCRWPFMCSTSALRVTRRCDGRETLFWWWCRCTS